MSTAKSGDLARRIWALCHILRGDGVGYHEYISELTYLLFLKIADETGTETTLPEGYRWRDLVSYDGPDLLTFYRDMLTYLGGHAASPIVQEIYAFPTTVFSHQENLRAVINGLAKLDWHSVTADGMGDIYEGLLARNSQDARSGAGQYFTPRALVDSMVRLMKPTSEEMIQDPSCGTGGFLIAAKQFVERTHSGPSEGPRFEGVEIEKSTYRICQMNSFLHRLNSTLILGDALTSDAQTLSKADLVLANPPFGNKVGSARTVRKDLPHRTANKQLAFVQHIRLTLKEGGRAAVVVPDNVLFESGVGRAIRRDLMAECNLHTILRLPNGIFYSQGVNTNVLFFTRRSKSGENTSRLWVYDMRTSAPRFGRTRPLLAEHFAEFEALYGKDPHGSDRALESEHPRWRSFDRAEITEREDNLDLVWLTPKDDAEDVNEPSAQELTNTIMFHLQSAIAEIELLAEELPAEDVES
ncbi:N-6 DNA methylase [Sinorhizobium medicae]|uniref:class I SAM-dependent DNA methyltransferase n=1 Tax=Sinorhizobium medicae TaxID=110321 RepID=UPI0013259BC7|nr:N-6 DNA methylase [Sinorhizobium medicae]MDX0469424.1 N-6 DNA methylase [Sinorhizobium medicae]MDX0475747.1 N-6 DNA methylase [Sinorhizobium medicae]MDX0900931.1 N-6 DNA methylase [Sinorhizobium medicae]MDX1176542.1 N-6 DNA methylase [Sinorhizobium medicae]